MPWICVQIPEDAVPAAEQAAEWAKSRITSDGEVVRIAPGNDAEDVRFASRILDIMVVPLGRNGNDNLRSYFAPFAG